MARWLVFVDNNRVWSSDHTDTAIAVAKAMAKERSRQMKAYVEWRVIQEDGMVSYEGSEGYDV